jgi:hypothetical protein
MNLRSKCKIRGRTKALKTVGMCREEGALKLHCFVECDGGGVPGIAPKNKQSQAAIQHAGRLIPLASALALCLTAPANAQSGDPIKIGVIAEVQAIAGAATLGGAQIAADEINAKGGILGREIEIVTYDNKQELIGGLGASVPARGQRGQGLRGNRELHQRRGAGAGAVGGAASPMSAYNRRCNGRTSRCRFRCSASARRH